MARKFDPTEYNYELANECKTDGVFHFQKRITKNKVDITDLIELSFWSRQNIWMIFISSPNLKPYLPSNHYIDDDRKIPLFIGTIMNDFDYQFQTKRICMDPKVLIQLGA